MEPKPDGNKTFKTGSKQHLLKKILSVKDTNRSSSSSSSSSKKTEESKRTTPNYTEKSTEDVERPASGGSPDPHCAICLEPIQNKSFTDSCFHTFCFTCLLEWSKVKPECPLCKQQFKSIVHNVRQDMTYDVYAVGSKADKLLAHFRTEQRFRYSTTMTASRLLERNRAPHQESYQSQIASHRMRFAPHSVNMFSNAQIMSRLPCPFRRRVYEHNLWVKTPLGGRSRVATPEFYKRNQACTHRLIPWLNRELVSLWQDNEAHVSFVLELIMSLVVRYHINSQEFLIHIEPYMGRNTHHFIHEFYAFAISPYDMENYDAHADYGLVPHSTDDAERSSPDSDVIAIFTGENSSLPRQNRERKNINQQALNHLKMILKKSGGNKWESYLTPASSSFMSSSWSNPGPSTSGFRTSNFLPVDGNSSNFTSMSDIEPTDDDDVQVLDIVKPRGERTPEIVDISSDEETPVTVIDVSSDEGNFSSSSITVHAACSPSRMTPPLAAVSVNEASSDIECVLEYQPSTSRDIPTTSEVSAEKDTKVEEKQEKKELHHDSSDTELESDFTMNEKFENEVKKAPKLASAIVRPWMTESDSSHKAFVPEIKRRFSSSYLDDSLSESSDSERKRSPKKLKLQSVVACFSIDRSSSKRDSSHRSSHKKRKEKKKKKKHKHIRQHKYNRIYSESDSG